MKANRIYTNVEIFVESSIFLNLPVSVEGAAIFVNSDKIVSILDCIFEKCISTDKGGSISAYAAALYYARCCSYACYARNPKNNVFGNHILADLISNAILIDSSAVLCGEVASESADSTIALSAPGSYVSHLNFSHCSSTGGSSGICNNRNTDSIIDSCIIVGGKASHAYSVEPYPCRMTVNNGIIINLSIAFVFGYSTDFEGSSLIFNSCKLIGDYCNKLAHGNVSFVDCRGNFECETIFYLENLTSLFIYKIMKCENIIYTRVVWKEIRLYLILTLFIH